MLFVGIDLAWSKKNATGVAILEGDKTKGKWISGGVFFSDEEMITFIKKYVKNQNVMIAIDAPLIVPNEGGRRVAEELTGSLFRRYNAGAHPANRKRLSSWGGKIRGEELSNKLEKEGFIHDPYLKKYEETKKFFEVYPHPSMVVLFNLDKVLKYKAKPKRDYESRWEEFKKYQSYLKNLKDPAISLPKEILEKDVKKLKGKELKNYEDLLDAIFCAYIAFYSWKNPDKCRVLGNMKEGYIMTPVFDHLKEQLKGIESQKKLKEF